MKNCCILGVDFGSAYTKVSWRSTWNCTSKIVKGMPVNDHPDITISSIAARVRRGTKSEWLIGAEAATQWPGKSVAIYRNWKQALLHPKRASEVPAAWPDSAPVEEVAVAYFRKLREAVIQRAGANAAGAPARFSLPAIGDHSAAEIRFRKVLTAAGWELAENEPFVSEPEANVIGVLTRGLNLTWRPRSVSNGKWVPRALRFNDMIDSDELRQTCGAMNPCFDVLAVDIGAYTTDFGRVRIDTSFSEDEVLRLKVKQKSEGYGIRNLDDAVRGKLSAESQDLLDQLSWADWDSAKKQLYARKTYRIALAGGGHHDVGAGKEMRVVERELAAFAKKIIELQDDFIAEAGGGQIHLEALTGGGTFIRSLRHELWGKDDPSANELWRPRHPTLNTGVFALSAAEQDRRRDHNALLRRAGTAMGAASVFFERNS